MDNIIEAVVEQIALEGLDGITIPTLWLRLNQAEVEFPLKLNDKIQQKILQSIISHHELSFYKLQNARAQPQIFNRFPEKAQIGCHFSQAPDEQEKLLDVYPIAPVSDDPNFIRGSCSEYTTRKDVTPEIFENIKITEDFLEEQYGLQHLVIVASQRLRSKVLLDGGKNLYAMVLFDLTVVQYCILERLGRARCQGELQSILDQNIFKDHKTYHIHYVMRTLSKLNLVTRKTYSYIFTGRGQRANSPQILLQHVRYANSKFAQYESVQQIALNMLEAANSVLGFDLKNWLELDTIEFKKLHKLLVKSSKREVKVIHPESASKAEKGDLTKKIYQYVGKKNYLEQTTAVEDDDSEPIIQEESENQLVVEHPFVLQAYHYILEHATEGVTHTSLLKCFAGYGKLEARNMHRTLTRMNLVKTVLEDRGRQRLQKFVPTQLVQNNELFQDFLDAKKKMKYLVLTSCFNNTDCQETTDDIVCLAKEFDNESLMDKSSGQNEIQNILSDDDKVLLNDTPEVKDLSFMSMVTDTSLALSEPETHLDNKIKWDANLTTKNLSRRNIILSHVNLVRVVEGFSIFYNLIVKEESSGSGFNIDRKTVRRLIDRMSKEGFLKLLKIELSVCNKQKTDQFWFIAAAQATDKEIKDAINQTKFRLATDVDSKIKRDIKATKERQYEQFAQSVPHGTKLKPPHGQLPKFLKYRELHRFLFFLTYWNEADCQKAQQNYAELSEEEIAWRTHVPLLPNHPDPALKGRFTVGDLLSVMPIYILCHIQTIDQLCDEFINIVQNEKTKYLMLANIPDKLKATLVYRRKHVFSVVRTLECMAFLGMVSLGKGGMNKSASQHRKRELDSIYVHKNLTIFDTSQSKVGYMAVSQGQYYEKKSYCIDSLLKIDLFWQHLEKISLLTQLGSRILKKHKTDLSSAQTAFLADHFARDPDLDDVDIGAIPGDGLGACGYDSSLFLHMFKNWSTHHFKQVKKYANKRPLELLDVEGVQSLQPSAKKTKNESKKMALPVKKNNKKTKILEEKTPEYEIAKVNNVGRSKLIKGGRGMKRKLLTKTVEKNMAKKKPAQADSFSKKPNKRLNLDDIDKAALEKRNGRIRASFHSSEDSLLILCHVASIMIKRFYHIKTKFPLQMIFSPRLIRDILMADIPEYAYDKTAESCSRRIRFLMGFSQTRMTRDMCVLDAERDPALMELLSNVKYDSVNDLQSVYRELVKALAIKYDKQPGLCFWELPNTVKELHKAYRVRLIKPFKRKSSFIPRRKQKRCVKSSKDVKKFMLENLVYCALLAKKSSYKCTTKQLTGIFMPYEANDLQVAFNELKVNSTVTSKPRKYKAHENVIPFTLPSYRLNYKFHKLFSNLMSDEDLESLTNLIKLVNKFNCTIESNIGQVIAMCNILLSGRGNIDLVLPQSLMSLKSLEVLRKAQEENDYSDTESNNEKSRIGHDGKQKVGKRKYLNSKYTNAHVITRMKELDDINIQPCLITVNPPEMELKHPEKIIYKDLETIYYEDFDVMSEYDKYVKEFPHHKEVFCEVIRVLEIAGTMGIPVELFFNKIREWILDLSTKLFEDTLADLLDRKLVYKLGISHMVYVLHNHVKDYFVSGFKYHRKTIENIPENSATSSENSNDSALASVDPSNYTAIQFHCQIWHKVDGDLNPHLLRPLLTSLYCYIHQNPGVTFDELAMYYNSVLHPPSLQKVLDSLCHCGCIEKHILLPKKRKHLFGRVLKEIKPVMYYMPIPCSEHKFSELTTKLSEMNDFATNDDSV